MATRFGGVVKAVLTAVDGKSFLEAKLEQTAALEGALDASVPVALMTSFATDATNPPRTWSERGLGDPLVFHQFVSLRLEASGELFRDDDGAAPRCYAPGHGDLFQATPALGHAHGLARARRPSRDDLERRQPRSARGSRRRRRCTSLGGRPLHLRGRTQARATWGSARPRGRKLPARRGPALPPSFDQELAPVFNTNTALVDIDALDEDYDLTWLYVQKTVDGRDAVQLERLVPRGVRRSSPTQYLEVPRRGPRRARLCRSRRRPISSAREDDLRELRRSFADLSTNFGTKS